MKVLNQQGKEVNIGDHIYLPDRKGRKHHYEITGFEDITVRVIEHHNDMKWYWSIPYKNLKLRTPYAD